MISGRRKPLNVLEKDFNATMRICLRGRGLEAIHIVEADLPGPADLIVYHGATIIAWLELKIDDEALRPSQVEFLRRHDKLSGNAFVVRMAGGTGIVSIERPQRVDGWSTDNAALMVLHRTADLHRYDWLKGLVGMKRGSR
jgi:hypothetical protein